MIDSPEDYCRYNPLQNVLLKLNSMIFPIYQCENKLAMSEQKIHNFFTFIAIGSGTVAIFAALFILSDIYGQLWPHRIEILAAVVSLSIVIAGSHLKSKKKWLFHRSKSESLRMLKFRALIDPMLLCGYMDKWETKYTTKIESIKNLSLESLPSIVKSDVEIETEFVPCDFVCEKNKTISLVGFYRDKRINFQKKYFISRIKEREEKDQYLKIVPLGFFFLGVGMAALDFVFYTNPSLELLSLYVAILAAGFPILGLAIRAYRSSKEYGRSNFIFRAKLQKLDELDTLLQTEISKPLLNGTEISSLLIQCENILEEENYEWMRLMIEAEWYL